MAFLVFIIGICICTGSGHPELAGLGMMIAAALDCVKIKIEKDNEDD